MQPPMYSEVRSFYTRPLTCNSAGLRPTRTCARLPNKLARDHWSPHSLRKMRELIKAKDCRIRKWGKWERETGGEIRGRMSGRESKWKIKGGKMCRSMEEVCVCRARYSRSGQEGTIKLLNTPGLILRGESLPKCQDQNTYVLGDVSDVVIIAKRHTESRPRREQR